ncbi:MAG TPA: hypothetical protein VF824_12740 [Thermoanaerobaculia bacterium]
MNISPERPLALAHASAAPPIVAMLRYAVLAIALSACAAPLFADCAPQRTMKIVTAMERPGLAPDAYAAQPRTLYRLGTRYARLEEPENPAEHVHGLIIVSEPDIWMINLADLSGQHIVDPGPSIDFHAPVLDAVDSHFWWQLEFGCEEAFMKAAGARVERNGDTVRYTRAAEGATVQLVVANGAPQRIEIATSKGQYAIRYLTFEMLDDTSTERYRPPEQARIVEAPKQ